MRFAYVAVSLIAAVLLLGICCYSCVAAPAFAGPHPTAGSTPGRLYAGGPHSPYRRLVEERVMQLPEDGGDWHFIVVADGAAMAQFDQAIASSPRLASLARQAKHQRFASGSWRPR